MLYYAYTNFIRNPANMTVMSRRVSETQGAVSPALALVRLCILATTAHQNTMIRKRTAPRPNLRQKSVEVEVIEESEDQLQGDEKLE